MITAEEWDGLGGAVRQCRDLTKAERDETFGVGQDGALVRSVKPVSGDPYRHPCPAPAFEAAARAVEELATGITGEAIRERARITWTEAAVALAFLKQRGVIVPAVGRTHAVAGSSAFEDAMIEYHALREKV